MIWRLSDQRKQICISAGKENSSTHIKEQDSEQASVIGYLVTSITHLILSQGTDSIPH